MMEGMTIPIYGCRIDAVLSSPRQGSEKAEMLLDEFCSLPSDAGREAFVSALISRVLILRARSGFASAKTASP